MPHVVHCALLSPVINLLALSSITPNNNQVAILAGSPAHPSSASSTTTSASVLSPPAKIISIEGKACEMEPPKRDESKALVQLVV